MRAYPDAKVVLTVRDPDGWYESMRSTVYPVAHTIAEGSSPEDRGAIALGRELVFDGFFNGRFDDRQAALALFAEHNRAVQREVPSEHLLVYEVSEGWGPLCEFLGTPLPPVPFPKTNERAGFRRRAGLDQ